MSNAWLQNLVVAGSFALLGWALVHFFRSERWRRPAQRFRRSWVGIISALVVVGYLAVGATDLILLPDTDQDGYRDTLLDWCFHRVPTEASYSAPLARTDFDHKPLKGLHLFGTDALGKDVLHETLKACRTALLIGVITSLIYIPIGIFFGLLAGYFKGWVDDLIQYLYSTVASVPSILLLVSILVVLGKGIPQITFALGITGWVGLCRLLRGETFRQTQRQYCEAARALGQSHWKIVFRHVLPNVMHLVIINFVLGFGGIVLAESILSYIGVGVPIGTASWGIMIDAARMELSREPAVWWNIVAATGALFFLVLALNLLGDALRKAFDPKAA